MGVLVLVLFPILVILFISVYLSFLSCLVPFVLCLGLDLDLDLGIGLDLGLDLPCLDLTCLVLICPGLSCPPAFSCLLSLLLGSSSARILLQIKVFLFPLSSLTYVFLPIFFLSLSFVLRCSWLGLCRCACLSACVSVLSFPVVCCI